MNSVVKRQEYARFLHGAVPHAMIGIRSVHTHRVLCYGISLEKSESFLANHSNPKSMSEIRPGNILIRRLPYLISGNDRE